MPISAEKGPFVTSEQVLGFLAGSSLVLGLMAGFIMHRADFCLVRAFRDLFLFRDGFMLRQLVLATTLSLVLFELAQRGGMIGAFPFPMMGAASPTHILGGALFGIGMVLAGGCVVGTLYRAGSGSLLAWLAIVGIVAGTAVYVEIHDAWLPVRQQLAIPGAWNPARLIGLPSLWLKGALVITAACFLWRWQQRGLLSRTGHAQGYLQPWKAAVGMALIGALSALLVGMPMGITTSYAKISGWLQDLALPGRIEQLSLYAERPLNFHHLLSGTQVVGGPAPVWDGIAAIQLPLILGILLGAALSARQLGEWRLHYRIPGRQALCVLLGGFLMGLAARLAPGCNVWHLLGGIPILSLDSILFVLGLFPGAWLGARLLQRWAM